MVGVRVLIVDQGRERSSVAAARGLVARGWTVGAGSVSPNLAARSRAVSAWHQIADIGEGNPAFVASVDEVVAAHGYEAVFVCWEAAVAALSAGRERLRCPLGYGPHSGVMQAMDKEQLMLIAGRAGLAVPRTIRATREGVAGMSAPVVIKPASPVDGQLQAMVFEDVGAALGRAEVIESSGGRAIAQEQLSGSLVAVSLVAGGSGIVSICQQVAAHAWPRPVGVTARGMTVAVDPSLRARIERLLEELRWEGLAQLQFLVPGDGEPRLLDFNPRYYGSIALAIRAGANHPDVWARLATGRPVRAVTGRPGATFQWFSRDLRASLAAPYKSRDAAGFLYTAVTAAHSLWSWREPWLAPSFLCEQAGRAASGRLPSGSRRGEDEVRSARLHALPATPAVRKALRTRRVPTRPERIAQRLLMKAGRLSYEESWLTPLQAAREAALGGEDGLAPRLLVRVDEFPYYSGLDTPKFGREASRRFHAVMAEEGVAHLMSVVPQWTHDPMNPAGSGGRALDKHDRALLEQMRSDGVTFAQHGHTHRTRHADPRRQSEMCGLSPGELCDLLDQGRAKLAAVGIHPRILVPPFNRFDAGQWSILAQRYEIITGGPESIMKMGFHGGPQWRGEAIYAPCYAQLYATAAAVLPAIETLIERGIGGWIPVVLHMGWEIDDDYAALRRLARRMAPYASSWEDLLARADACRQE
jgi:predicted ATP-grasp superfamily ATP-dependent carboligase